MRLRFLVSLLILFSAVEVHAQCDPSLIVPSDGTAIPTPVILSEVNPGAGGYIEVFNPGNAPFNVNGWWFCSPFNYSALPNVNIPAHSYMTFPWPGNFFDTDAGGEMMLYKSINFGNSNDIVNYIAWGASNGFRLGQAQSVGKWSGAAAPALVNGAIHRLTNTTGTGAASFDVSAAPSPMNCTGPTGIHDTPAHPSIALSIGPNPFSSVATIEYTLSSAAEVKTEVFTVTGARVRLLLSTSDQAGTRRVIWDGKNDAGRDLPSGTYLVRVSAGGTNVTQRVTIVH
jgi:hypothetical protein